MDKKLVPIIFQQLLSEGCINESDVLKTQDGFWVVYKSLSDILYTKEILDVPGSGGTRLACNRFFDDWFLYAVPDESEHIYSLLKLREQEHDAQDGLLADGDTPGVTISFISFAGKILCDCIADPTDENRKRLDHEINRVVAHRGQSHHAVLKRYFVNPKAEGAYLVASLYVKQISSYAVDGCLEVPECYKEMVRQRILHKGKKKFTRIPSFIDTLNQEAGCVICDHQKIYIKNQEELTIYEAAAILGTHTGNTSCHSFAAEVEYHAKFLTPMAKVKLPILGRSVYDSAIRADMTIGDMEFEGPAPFHRPESKIVKRQCALHQEKSLALDASYRI